MTENEQEGIALLGLYGIQAVRLVRVALACALLSTLLFIACSTLQMAYGFNVLVQILYVIAHPLAAFGVSMLLWSVVSVPDEVGGSRDKLPCLAVFAVIAYHLMAMVCFALAFKTNLYDVTVGVWWLRTLLCIFIIIDFIFFGDTLMTAAGVLLLIAFGAGGPYALPEGLGIAQWILAKLATIALYFVLYRCAVRIYTPEVEEKM